MIAVEGFESLRSRAVRRVEITFDGPVRAEDFANVAGVEHLSVEQDRLRCLLTGQADDLIKAAARFRVVTILAEEPDLEELFLTLYRGEEAPDAA